MNNQRTKTRPVKNNAPRNSARICPWRKLREEIKTATQRQICLCAEIDFPGLYRVLHLFLLDIFSDIDNDWEDNKEKGQFIL